MFVNILDLFFVVTTKLSLPDHTQLPDSDGTIAPMPVEILLSKDAGVYWLRWWDELGNLLLTGDERAITEKQARLEAEAIANQERVAEQKASRRKTESARN